MSRFTLDVEADLVLAAGERFALVADRVVLAHERPAGVSAATERFVRREQLDVIQRDYDRMREHEPTGEPFTWMLTFIGEPSVPGASSYADAFPVTVSVETPGPETFPFGVDNPAQGTVTFTSPFPAGNIAAFDDRWELITRDTLPVFQRLLDDHPEQVRERLETDMGERIDAWRLTNPERVRELLARLGDRDVEFVQ